MKLKKILVIGAATVIILAPVSALSWTPGYGNNNDWETQQKLDDIIENQRRQEDENYRRECERERREYHEEQQREWDRAMDNYNRYEPPVVRDQWELDLGR